MPLQEASAQIAINVDYESVLSARTALDDLADTATRSMEETVSSVRSAADSTNALRDAFRLADGAVSDFRRNLTGLRAAAEEIVAVGSQLTSSVQTSRSDPSSLKLAQERRLERERKEEADRASRIDQLLSEGRQLQLP